jgi:hypothetical protein
MELAKDWVQWWSFDINGAELSGYIICGLDLLCSSQAPTQSIFK